jgi:hypothetical protein
MVSADKREVACDPGRFGSDCLPFYDCDLTDCGHGRCVLTSMSTTACVCDRFWTGASLHSLAFVAVSMFALVT